MRKQPSTTLTKGVSNDVLLSVPARYFCLRAKVAPTTHFLGPDISRKGKCTSIFLICKREETVRKLRK